MALVKGAVARREFDRFVADSSEALLRTGFLLTWNFSEAEDLVQETLLRTARRWPDVRKMQFPRAYARRVLFNLAIRGSERRGMTRFEPAGTTSLEVMVDERFEAKLLSIDARSDIEAALSLLPLRQRAVIVLRYYEDLSESEIAGVLGWPVGTVKSTTSRALDELRSSMSDRVDGAGESFLKTVPTTRGVSDERST